MQARIAGQNPQQALPNGATPQRGPAPTNGALPLNGTPGQTNQNLTVPGQNRARGPIPPQMAGQVQMANGLRVPQPIMNGVPQAQMQGMQNGQLPMPNPALDVGLVARAQNISEQQRQAIRMQQAGQIPMQGQNGQIHNSPPRIMNNMSPPNFPQMANGNMLPFNPNNANGVSSPGLSPSQGQAGSPRMGQLQQLSNGMVPQAIRLEESIRQKYPNATTEQVMRMISDALAKSAHQRQGLAQSAMNAAAGGNMNGMVSGQGMVNGGQGQSPQLYAQMLRQQQEAQQKQAQAAAQAQAVQAQAVQAQASAVQNQQGNAQGHQRSTSAASGNSK
jgi:chromatin modification-related protein VID21